MIEVRAAIINSDIKSSNFPDLYPDHQLVYHTELPDAPPGRLVLRPTNWRHNLELEGVDPTPGVIRHQRSGKSYRLLELACWMDPRHVLGVCYVDEDGTCYFRPLHTGDSKGFLDDVDGQPRFVRVNDAVRS